MKKWNISAMIFAVAAFIFTIPGMQPAIGADAPGKVEKAGKATSSAETKMMKTGKAPKTKTMPNKVDKTKAKTGAAAQPFIPGGSSLSAATTP